MVDLEELVKCTEWYVIFHCVYILAHSTDLGTQATNTLLVQHVFVSLAFIIIFLLFVIENMFYLKRPPISFSISIPVIDV